MACKYDSPIKQTKVASHWQMLSDNLIQCEVCPRQCKLKDQQHGHCYVRQRVGDKLVLNTFEKITSMAVDPIEKKPLFHFLPGSKTLSFGTPGCNLSCSFCQNWNLSRSKSLENSTSPCSATEIVSYALNTYSKSVAFTYNDPIIFMEFAIEVAKHCHNHGLKTVAVSSGYMNPAAREELYSHIDAANVDLKSFSESFYKKMCSASLKAVLETLSYLRNKTKVWFEITTLLIEGENDSDEELDAMTRWIVKELGTDTPLHFSAFYPAHHLKDKQSTSLSTLLKARDIAMKNGLNYVYTGNVSNPDTENTLCPGCNTLIIKRNRYSSAIVGLNENLRCTNCDTKIAGCFD